MTARWRRVVALAVAVVSAVALTACAGLPTEGPVNGGLPRQENPQLPDISFLPDRPQPGATPEQIIDGFLRAGSGPTDNWAVARLYLAPSFRDVWSPEAGVKIDVFADRTPTVLDDGSVELNIAQVATVDDAGVYRPDRATDTLPFSLALDDDGQWRITDAPNGIVLDEDQFDSVYRPYTLAFFDLQYQFLVPDVRWFPPTNLATRIAVALVDGGPSPWLTDSVRNAVPDNIALSPVSVTVEGGVATVGLSPTALSLDQTTRDRMLTQLRESMASANIPDTVMSVSGTVLDAQPVGVQSTLVNTLPLVWTADGFGFVSGDTVPGLDDAMRTLSPAPVAITASAGLRFAAARLADGSVVRVQSDGGVLLFDTRAGLIDPSVDPQGFVWSVPADAPADIVAFSPGSERIVVRDAWPGASRISAMEVSRDGARVAAIVTAEGRSEVWVSGIIRNNGVPARLGEAVVVATIADGEAFDLSWLDERGTTLGALVRDSAGVTLLQQTVGGLGVSIGVPQSVTTVAGSNSVAGARIRDADGVLYVRRGSTWQTTGTDVSVLATQSGPPF